MGLDIPKAFPKAFEEHPHWQTSERQGQQVGKSVYKGLIEVGAEKVVDLATRLMKMLRRASS